MSTETSHAHKAAQEPMPPGIHNVYIFDTFNTASWSAVLGAPMLLFFQHLNATATVVAIAFSLSPLLIILQIPAARFVEQVGYRRFVLAGWTSRSFLIVGMTIVAFLPESVDRTTCIVLMLFLSLVYNALRGISSCGLLPWFTHIVPEGRRGEFLAKDQTAVAFASVVSLCSYGLLFSNGPGWHPFGIVFATSYISAVISLQFLRKVPDVPVEKIQPNQEPLPFKEMLFHPPFFKYLRYVVVVNLALGASGAFWVRYFKAFLLVSSSGVLFVAAASALMLIVVLFLITPVIDRTHNKQVLTLSGIMFVVHFAGWACVAAGIFPFRQPYIVPILIVQTITTGIGGALWNLANIRMVMSIVPVMGRPHFLALYTVAGNVTVGLIPLLWGPVMDYLETWRVSWGYWNWNAYSLLYCTLSLIMIVSLCVLRSVHEPPKMSWDVFMRELLVKTPGRALSRVLGRLRGPSIG